MARYIFCTGGVVSGVGKGVTAAAIGRLLKARGVKVAIQKLDPYLNMDPGTMNPYQHYERFIDENLPREANVTAGRIYDDVIHRERRGDFLGGTIQVVPHITNEIKERIKAVARSSGADVIIIEVGGTVGDIESQPFLEALRQLRNDLGRKKAMSVHVTYLPYLAATRELKTKPTQHSVRDLRSIGIQPNIIIPRTDYPVSKEMTDKIALFCDVDPEAVIPMETTKYLYEVPLMLEDAGLGEYIVSKLRLKGTRKPDLTEWRAMVEQMKQPKPAVKIALVGKYVELHDAYMSVKEALFHAANAHDRDLEIDWILSTDLEKGKGQDRLREADGIIVPGGFGERGIEGKIAAATFARENNIPYLGLCLGMQTMCIEFARNVLHLKDANSTEFSKSCKNPVIDLMADQHNVQNKGGTMRLGKYECCIEPRTLAAAAYGQEQIFERHRHRWEFNNSYRRQFQDAGMIFSGTNPAYGLVEISELRDHRFMLGVQFHPEFLSRPNRPHPLFSKFIEAAIGEGQAADPSDEPSERLEIVRELA
jgi:CTP synthase